MADKKVSKRSIAVVSDYRETFATDFGQRVLWDMMKQFMLRTSYADGNPHGTAFNEGQRDVLLHILRKLKTDPQKLLKEIEKGIEHEASWDEDFI